MASAAAAASIAASNAVSSSFVASPSLSLAPARLSSVRGLRRSLTFSPSKSASCRSNTSLSISAVAKNVDITKVVPQGDRVLVKLEDLPEKSVGGVLLPKSAVKFEHYLCGEVVSVGKEAASISTGQKVLFSDMNAYEINLGTVEKLCFVKAEDLLAWVE